MANFKETFDLIIAAIKQSGEPAVDEDFKELTEQVKKGEVADPTEIGDFQKALRGERAFSSMVRVGEIFSDIATPTIRTYHAQGLIDTGKVSDGLKLLEDMRQELGADLNGRDLKEVLGLVGRAYKQAFVSAIARGNLARAEQRLKASFDSHQEGFDLDPAWAGANMAALAWRAHQEGLDIGADPCAVADKALAALPDEDASSLWQLTAHAQAWMAKDEWDRGTDLYRRFVQMLQTTENRQAAFMLFGDRRQLREIWLCNKSETEPERKKPLDLVVRAIGEGAYNKSSLTADELRIIETVLEDVGEDSGRQLQRMVADGRYVEAAYFEALQSYHAGICRVEKRPELDGGSPQFVGTGFLINGAVLHEDLTGKTLLATNWHVMADKAARRGQITPCQAQIRFERWDGFETVAFNIGDICWTSSDKAFDVTIAHVEGLPDGATTLPISASHTLPPPEHDVEDLGFVNPVGHPLGSPLSYSLSGNDVIDHNMTDDGPEVQVVHYAANTEKGSSGSPVFDQSAQVVAIHHATCNDMISGSQRPLRQRYQANEGIGVGSMLAAARAKQGFK